MISGIGHREFTAPAVRRGPEFDALTERRVEESRKLAVSMAQQDHQRRVQAAIAANMERLSLNSTPLTKVKSAYSEF